MKQVVIITETLRREVEVEASSPTIAISTVTDRYFNSEIVLDADDHVNTTFRIKGNSKLEEIYKKC